MEQVAIAMTGVVAIWLSQDARAGWRRWACIFGIAGQPFWFYAAYTAEQWGIFALCFLYSYAWLKGIRNNWLHTKPKLELMGYKPGKCAECGGINGSPVCCNHCIIRAPKPEGSGHG